MRSIVPLILALLVSPSSNPAAELSSSQGGVFSSVDLGFRFTPPPGLRDLTAALKERERRRTPDGRTHFAMLLWMASGPDDTAKDWVALGVETYPRGRDKDRGDDLTASFTTNVSALPGSTTERLVIKLSGQDFAVSRLKERNLYLPSTEWFIPRFAKNNLLRSCSGATIATGSRSSRGACRRWNSLPSV
jgi:hypothetical protein